jgi:hypothetical protein
MQTVYIDTTLTYRKIGLKIAKKNHHHKIVRTTVLNHYELLLCAYTVIAVKCIYFIHVIVFDIRYLHLVPYNFISMVYTNIGNVIIKFQP